MSAQDRRAQDEAAFRRLLSDLVVRLAARVSAVDPDKHRTLSTLRREHLGAALHEIGDAALRAEIDTLDDAMARLTRATAETLDEVERQFRTRNVPRGSRR